MRRRRPTWCSCYEYRIVHPPGPDRINFPPPVDWTHPFKVLQNYNVLEMPQDLDTTLFCILMKNLPADCVDMTGKTIDTETIYRLVDEMNEGAKLWKWIHPPNYSLELGSCYHYSKHINCHLVKHGCGIKDIIHSWKTEELHVECKSALFIFCRVLMYEKFGEQYCNDNIDKFHYTDGPCNQNAIYSMPFNSDLTPVKKGEISNAIFHFDVPSRLDYCYISGTIMHTIRAQSLPLLQSCLQGENTLVIDPLKYLHLGYFRQDELGTSSKYDILKRTIIEQNLVDRSKRDFEQKYPDSLYDINKLTKLQPINKCSRTILDWENHYEYDEHIGKYVEINIS